MKPIVLGEALPQGFFWFNEPPNVEFDEGVTIYTEPRTDFWQRTHYGFRNNNGHSLVRTVTDDFSFAAHLSFWPQGKYDQCGLILYMNEDNWIKVSAEYENEEVSRLGSVVTNLGYSDWATTDISSQVDSMWYRISRRGEDVLIENSTDGETWLQMRICHLHANEETVHVGVYTCSPLDNRFQCRVTTMLIGECTWTTEEEPTS